MAEPLSLQQLGEIARRYWLVLVLSVLLGGLAGYFGARLIPPSYSATATQLVKGVPGTDATANYQAAQYAISRARTYPVFIHSLPVLEAVRGDAGGQIDLVQLEQDLSASNPIDTPLVQVTARAGTSQGARDMANSAARHLARYITQIETINGSSPVTVEVAVQASRPTEPTAPRPLLIGALSAFSLACVGLAGVAVYERAVRGWLAARRQRRKEASAPADERADDPAGQPLSRHANDQSAWQARVASVDRPAPSKPQPRDSAPASPTKAGSDVEAKAGTTRSA